MVGGTLNRRVFLFSKVGDNKEFWEKLKMHVFVGGEKKLEGI